MTITPGAYVRNPPASAYTSEDTILTQISNTSYSEGIPEVGVYFVAPASGRVRLTIGTGSRDNGAAPRDRVFVAPQLFRDSSEGTEIIAPSVTQRGYAAPADNTEFQYGSRASLIEGLVPGQLYYLRAMHLATPGTDPDSADLAIRDIAVIPLP